MDLIDRQAVIKALISAGTKESNVGRGLLTPSGLAAAIDVIGKVSSAEPEIIRCKDCRYTDEYGVCQSSKGLAIQDDDDFCSHAERRGG